jgi:hypothetical protein
MGRKSTVKLNRSNNKKDKPDRKGLSFLLGPPSHENG